ncbi:hypothetical protein M426DRAFT_14842 [Hypoxylon sp. CI-4A]|nr:hypothetical protein M426DRAFT_14842 [Hypoxylon sp. CI-4A]
MRSPDHAVVANHLLTYASLQIQPVVTSNTDAQDGTYPTATLNGTSPDVENKQIAEIVDELVHSAEVSVSGGSDTETSKARFGDKNHARASSTVKKPQSFKSVSVNRTFLASKTTNPGSRPDSAANSASSTPQPTPTISASRLKLVAKSGTSLGGSTKTLSSNGKPAAAPDGNSVWNRNRPITQPEQKKLSDEELVHKYGIHMAGRLGPEDAKGQSNWADIDDDEEWAPETITWGDGTKITLPHSDETAPSPSTVPATLHKEVAPLAPPKSKSPAPVASATASPTIKPGVPASAKSLVLKGVPEKPTLVAKPPVPPMPAKSPWARLPPVEKLPPGQLDTPTPPTNSYPPVRDHVAKNVAPPLTKEIAADDFSRSGFRENHVTNHNQLYNSHSGRYEPVMDRRGSRNDIPGRQPAVLQRPQHHELQGPAEPSAAFQTSRTTGEVSFNRRRGSSNVSGTSGGFAHMVQSRSGSIAAGGAESPISNRTFSPANTQPTPRLQPSNPYQPRPSAGQAMDAPLESDFIVQKQLMHERREHAIKRRLEQEERERVERDARIAEKLKALGPAPERKSEKENRKDDVIDPARRASTSAGTDTNSRAAETSNHVVPGIPASMNSIRPDIEHRVNGEAKRPRTQTEKAQPTPQWPETPQHSDRFPPWGSGSQNTARNVWGAPGNDRSLGNGTFNPGLGALPDSHAGPITERNNRPSPIGPPRSAPYQSMRPESGPNNRLAPIGPPRGRPSNAPQASEQIPSNPWQGFASSIQEDDHRQALEMQELAKAQKQEPTLAMNDRWRPHSKGAYQETKHSSGALEGRDEARLSGSFSSDVRNTATNVVQDEPRRPQKGLMPTDFAAAREASGRQANGVHPDFSRQSPANSTEQAAPRQAAQPRSGSRFFPAARGVSQEESSFQEPVRTKSPSPPPPTADGHPVFDGDASRPHVALPPARPIVKLPPSISSPAPSPVVSAVKPAPVSFAAAAAAAAAPAKTHAQPAIPRPSSRGKGYSAIPQTAREIALQENWQDKINSLMGKKSSPPVKSMTVVSSTKIALEHSHSYDPATVALPGLSLSVSSVDSDDSDYISKEMAEECFGEQEMGSLPAVRLPSDAPDALWQAVEPNFEPAPAKLRVNATGAESFRFLPEMANGKITDPTATLGEQGRVEGLDAYLVVVGSVAAERILTTTVIILHHHPHDHLPVVLDAVATDLEQKTGPDTHRALQPRSLKITFF